MLLNAENILNNIMGGSLEEFGAKAQVGIDLSVCNITEVVGGQIGKNNKFIIPYVQLETTKNIIDFSKIQNGEDEDYNIKSDGDWWNLEAYHVYSLTFDQSIKLPTNKAAFVIGKSTLMRVGVLIRSALFDPGFECNQIGATLFCFCDVDIEKGSKLAQLIVFDTEEAEAYNGNYQGDKDLK